ncbi:hypothetical protein mvi_931 [Megavirus vitis]|nr:hypothetical protein mvi_931 [Megavirus vitis]
MNNQDVANIIFIGIGLVGTTIGLLGAKAYITYKEKRGYFDKSSSLSIGLIGGIIGALSAYAITTCIVTGIGAFMCIRGIYYGVHNLINKY